MEKRKTPNGSDWPMNYAEHTQEQMNYAWRSPGSWMPRNLEEGLRYRRSMELVTTEEEPETF